MKKTKIIDIVQALETRGIKTGIGKGNGINGDYIELTLRAGNSPVTTSFDIESVYRDMENGKMLDDIIDSLISCLPGETERKNKTSQSSDAFFYESYEEARKQLTMKAISIKRNRDLLKKIPHFDMEDIAFIFYLTVETNNEFFMLTDNKLMKHYNVEVETLKRDAISLALYERPLQINSMNDFFPIVDDEAPELYVCTAGRLDDQPNGALVLAYPDFCKRVMDKLGGRPFYVLPSSIHEVLVTPADDKIMPHMLLEMVKSVNSEQVDPKERLTDNVYYGDENGLRGLYNEI